MKIKRFKHTFTGMKECEDGNYVNVGHHLSITDSLVKEKRIIENKLQRVEFQLNLFEKENKAYSDIVNKIGISLQSLPREEKDKTVLTIYKEYHGTIVSATIRMATQSITTIDIEKASE